MKWWIAVLFLIAAVAPATLDAGVIQLISNGGFATGALFPWAATVYTYSSNVTGGCVSGWAVQGAGTESCNTSLANPISGAFAAYASSSLPAPSGPPETSCQEGSVGQYYSELAQTFVIPNTSFASVILSFSAASSWQGSGTYIGAAFGAYVQGVEGPSDYEYVSIVSDPYPPIDGAFGWQTESLDLTALFNANPGAVYELYFYVQATNWNCQTSSTGCGPSGTSACVQFVGPSAISVGVANVSLTAVPAQSLQVTTTGLPNATSGQAYGAIALTATGGSATGYAWSISSGSLPAGFTLSSAGVLSSTGSPPAAAGSYSLTVQVTDSIGDTASQPLTLVVQCNLSAPSIIFDGLNVAGDTTTVVVGQEITLTGQGPTQACMVASQQWSTTPTGSAVGGWAVGALNESGGPPAPLPSARSNSYGPFYWTAPGTFTVTYQYSLNGATGPISSTATFDVVGPTNVQLYTCGGSVPSSGCAGSGPLGQVDIVYKGSVPYLALGALKSNVGIVFTASAAEPPGYVGSFVFVQLINYDETAIFSGGSEKLCYPPIEPSGSAFPGLDTLYPYPASKNYPNLTQDGPAIELENFDSELGRVFSATMYLMWKWTGPAGSIPIPVPLGSVHWGFIGAAKLTNQASNTWEVASGSASAGLFQPSGSYPAWTSLVPAGLKCKAKQ